ncbi:MAG TPA: Gldg family protein [Candidatus Sulfotelmatobacter sp.]|nr:Gldg family protein [Candidatus Sulfotelmatobacter sp.]
MTSKRREFAPLAGAVGLALLVFGYYLYSTREELQLSTKIVLIVGGVLILAWLVLGFRSLLGFFSKRSSKLGTNTTVLVIAVLAILVFLNYLGDRHHKTFDLTSQKLYTLSDQSKKIIDPIRADVRVYMFARSAGPEEQQVQSMKDQMAEYSDENHHIHFTAVDPQENPGLAKQYGITRMGEVVVVNGTHIEHLQDTAEGDITSAILKATSTTVKTVCFIEGHGEKSVDASDAKGLSRASAELEKENYQVKSVNLVTTGSVPSDCSALIDPGPTKAFFPQEAQMVEKYLDGGGKAMFLLDPGTDPQLGAVMQTWNMNVGDDYVIDVSGVGRLLGMGPGVPLVIDYGESPIVRNFKGTMTFFPLARTVAVADSSKTTPQATELLKTSDRSFTVASLGNGTVKYDPKKDQRGPLSLGVAAENNAGKADARLVVIGNSEFASNQWEDQQRDGDLFFNSVNWLTEESNLISIRPKEAANRRVTLTEAQQREVQWLSVIFVPLFVVVIGVIVWVKRR